MVGQRPAKNCIDITTGHRAYCSSLPSPLSPVPSTGCRGHRSGCRAQGAKTKHVLQLLSPWADQTFLLAAASLVPCPRPTNIQAPDPRVGLEKRSQIKHQTVSLQQSILRKFLLFCVCFKSSDSVLGCSHAVLAVPRGDKKACFGLAASYQDIFLQTGSNISCMAARFGY
jgi:hypothetical protein